MKKTTSKIKKTAFSLGLALVLCGGTSQMIQAATMPADVSTAPSISAQTLQHLAWQPLVPPVTQTVQLDASGSQINQGDIRGAVGAFVLPADRGSLEIVISSLVEEQQVYAPSVLVLDEQMRPAAFYPNSYFPYAQPGVMSRDRLEGTLKLTPALGQKQIYLLVYTTTQDLGKTTKMIAPAKAYAAGVGNAVPDIPDPLATHRSSGTLKVKVKAEQNTGNVMIGGVIPITQKPAPVVVGKTTPAPAVTAPTKPEQPMLKETDDYFNRGIQQAVKNGDIDRALKLMNEAERLGSTTARETFIRSVKGKG